MIRRSQLVLSIILAVLLAGSISAQTESETGNAKTERQIASLIPDHLNQEEIDGYKRAFPKLLEVLQYQDLCQYGPMTADVNNSTIYFSIPTDGACVKITVNDCQCPQPGSCPCTIILKKGTSQWYRWEEECTVISQQVDNSPIGGCTAWDGGEYELTIDMCPDGWVKVECCTCP